MSAITFKEAYEFFEQARDAAREAESVASKAAVVVEEMQGSAEVLIKEIDEVWSREAEALDAKIREMKAQVKVRLSEAEQASLAAEENKVALRSKANALAKRLSELLHEELKKN